MQAFAESLGKHPSDLVKAALFFAGFVSDEDSDIRGGRAPDLFLRSRDELLMDLLELNEQATKAAHTLSSEKCVSFVETMRALLQEALADPK